MYFRGYTSISFHDNTTMIYTDNVASTNGGTNFLNDSKLYFGATSVVTQTNNLATSYGGAVLSVNKFCCSD